MFIIRIGFVAVVLSLGVYSPFSSSAVYNIDPTQSFISVAVPTWERGSSWGFILADGTTEIGGYEWRQITGFETFGLNGSLEISPISGQLLTGLSNVAVSARNLVSTAPAELNFGINSSAMLDSATGTIESTSYCSGGSGAGEGSGNCMMTFPFLSFNGHLAGDKLSLSGSFSSLFNSFPVTVFGGLEPPITPPFSYANASYTFQLEATMVPEPSSALMLIVGLLPLLRHRQTSRDLQG